MKITYYNSAEYHNTTTETVQVILGVLDPDEITEDDKESLREGITMPMCNFADAKGVWHAVPWQFVIEIDE